MRQDQWSYTLTVDDRDLGVFSQKSGGDVTAESNKDWPGAMAEPEEMGAPASTDDITVQRRYKFDRDHPVIVWLEGRVGKGIAVLKGQPLDEDRNPVGTPRTWRGKVIGVQNPEHDAAGTDRGSLGVVIGIDGRGA